MAQMIDEQQDLINEFENKANDAPDPEEDDEVEAEETEDESTEDDEGSEEETEGDEDTENKNEDDNDDYVTTFEEEEPAKPVAVPAPPAAITQDDESKFILAGLTKLAVSIVVAGADGKDEVRQVEVYGFGDLPSNFKGYANPLEAERFRGAVTAQELKARELKAQYSQAQMQKQNDEYVTRENRAIAEDLKELRTDAVFPKFKGTPGTKEFDGSEGAKEFDRVLAFMKEENDKYAQAAHAGKAYRHIGFKQAFYMLNGDVKAREQAEGKARREVAKRVVSKRGTAATLQKKAPKMVTNLMDLADEFQPTAAK